MTWEQAVPMLALAAGDDMSFVLERQTVHSKQCVNALFNHDEFSLVIGCMIDGEFRSKRLRIAATEQLEAAVDAAVDQMTNWRLEMLADGQEPVTTLSL